MPIEHVVTEGDCVESIGYRYGFHPDTIWNHGSNAQLRNQRKDPNVLMPGDVLVIPDKETKEQGCATGQRHRFMRQGVPSKIRVVLNDSDSRPRAGIPYILVIDGQIFQGKTDDGGRIQYPIPPNAGSGELIVNPDTEDEERYSLQLGYLDPVTEITGIQARLNNLGFPCGDPDGNINEETRLALRKFQKRYGLPETGEPDHATRDKLKEEHGS